MPMPRVRRGRIARSFRDAASAAVLLPSRYWSAARPSRAADRPPAGASSDALCLARPLGSALSHTLAHTHTLFPFQSRLRAACAPPPAACGRDADLAARAPTPRATPCPSKPTAARYPTLGLLLLLDSPCPLLLPVQLLLPGRTCVGGLPRSRRETVDGRHESVRTRLEIVL
jgi:hypothetical protein